MAKDLEYYEKLDKRTKEYKEWKANKEKEDEASSKGLGDSVEKVLKATGVSDVVKFIAGEDCGCDERKEKLNDLFPYKNPECLTEDEYNWLSGLYGVKRTALDRNSQKTLVSIYNRVFHKKREPSNCSSCVVKMYKEMKVYFDEYNN